MLAMGAHRRRKPVDPAQAENPKSRRAGRHRYEILASTTKRSALRHSTSLPALRDFKRFAATSIHGLRPSTTLGASPMANISGPFGAGNPSGFISGIRFPEITLRKESTRLWKRLTQTRTEQSGGRRSLPLPSRCERYYKRRSQTPPPTFTLPTKLGIILIGCLTT